MAIDHSKQWMYIVTREDNNLYIVDLQTKQILFKQALEGEAYTRVLSPDSSLLYISCWGCDKVYQFNTIERKITASVAVGDNPNEIVLNKKGSVLYVANSNDNSVSVINTKEFKVAEVLKVALS